MFSISAADVFRTRQAVRDLKGFILSATDATIDRLAAGIPASSMKAERRTNEMRRWIEESDFRFSFPEDEPVYTAVLLAAALPDDDYPAFTIATALLLVDALQDGDGSDDLYWNWVTFAPQYRMADAPVRAALMNGFRALHKTGRANLGTGPSDRDCMTRTQSELLRILKSDDDDLTDLIAGNISGETAGRRWAATQALSQSALRAFRYLYERPSSIVPETPEAASLLPWRY